MFKQTDLDVHYADYISRTALVDRFGWMTEGMASPETPQDRGEVRFVERMRRRFGETLIGMGERMKGTTVDHTGTPETVKFGPAI